MSLVRRITFVLGAAVAVSATLLVLSPAGAAPGDLDPSFGADGIVQTEVGSSSPARGLALQPDGKIVLAGSPAYGGNVTVVRYLPDGSLDSSFGSDGIVVGPTGIASDVALEPDGSILVVGQGSNFRFSLERFLPDGSLDTTFGTNGIAFGPDGHALGIALQPDGQIVLAGTNHGDSFVLARFDPDGAIDLSFGTNGVVRTPFNYSAEARSVVVQPDGEIVAAGASSPGTPPGFWHEMALARYQPDGALDPAFGSHGTTTAAFGASSTSASSLALRADGTLIVAGTVDDHIGVAQFRPDGSLETFFGVGGVTVRPTGPWSTSGEDVALQPDGRIVVAGSANRCCELTSGFALVRYEPDGRLDRSFGYLGLVTSSFGQFNGAGDLALQADGRIVVAGYAGGSGGSQAFALTRYLVTTPSTITARPLLVDYGTHLDLRGRLTARQAGSVSILRRGCYGFAPTKVRRISAGLHGTWKTRVRPRTRATFWAAVGSERSSPVTVAVRPRLTLARTSAGALRARVVFGLSLAGEGVVLQRTTKRGWHDFRSRALRRLTADRFGVVSSVTFRVERRRGRRLRAVLPADSTLYRCFEKAVSRPIRD